MSPIEVLTFARRGILANKLRSALTTLGITIGVGAVILLVAVGNGASASVQRQIDALGTNRVTVSASGSGFLAQLFGGGSGLQSADTSITLADVDAVNDSDQTPDVAHASPVVTTTASAAYGAASADVSSVVGTDPEYLPTTNSEVVSGASFTRSDVERARKVAVIGPTVATNLFGGADPVGETISIDGTTFTVVGVLDAKGSQGPQDQDDTMLMPVTTMQRHLTGFGALDQVVVRATSSDRTDAAGQQVIAVLNERKGVDPVDSPYSTQDQASLLETSQETNETFTVLLGAVAAISLLVGGIGITNIMLVSVTERTREIGIRKAIGAPRRAVLAQFLAEAVGLSALGGLLGVAAGLVGARFEIVGIQPVVVPASVVLAVAVSVAIGLFFGSFPANRAASLRPIEALRHE